MTLLTVGLAAILLAGIISPALSARPDLGEKLFRWFFGVGSVICSVAASRVLAGASSTEFRFHAGIPGGDWVFGIDKLSALFLLIIAFVGGAAALYGPTYLRTAARRPRERLANLAIAILVIALALVVVARAAMPFLLAWEVMAISAYVLIVLEHERAGIQRAGLLYLAATHTATLALFALFAIWGTGAADLTFSSLATSQPTPRAETAILALALVGFGLKAGLVPLHFWLPEAHAAAPSHVSALMSGVVIKMGIYGLFRVVMLLDGVPAWWGWLVLTCGLVSGILGVLWALAQHDLKRLLAFHSVENIGIILLGIGAGVLGLAYGKPEVALLGFAGAALHTLNHALFKSLLFLGAGAVYHATGTREIERLGGLARILPYTSAAFLIGAVAIVGLPPLNGFVSEWLVFRSLTSAGFATSNLRIAIVAAAGLGLIGALALACFAKVVGAVYLGVGRHEHDMVAHECPAGMLRPQFLLAAACVFIGIAPVVALRPALSVASEIAHVTGGNPVSDISWGMMAWFGLALWTALIVTIALRNRLPHRDRQAETWAGAYPAMSTRMQYTASSFAAPLLQAYEPIAGVHTLQTAERFATHPTDPVLDLVLLPAWSRVRSIANRVRPLQRGRVSVYLLYMLAALIGLLLCLLFGWPGT